MCFNPSCKAVGKSSGLYMKFVGKCVHKILMLYKCTPVGKYACMSWNDNQVWCLNLASVM